MKECPHTFQSGNPITLVGPSGNKWEVRAEERSILSAGWREFARDHRLREGDQLHFTLRRPSHFVVEITDRNGDVKRSARKATVTGKYAVAPVGSSLSAPMHEHARKRKERETSFMFQDMATIADLCEFKRADARRGSNNNNYTSDKKLRFSERTKQRMCCEATDRREVVTILDSEDEELEEQTYGLSKVEGLIKFMKDSNCVSRKWTASQCDEIVKGDEVKRVATGEQWERNKREFSGTVQENFDKQYEGEDDHLDEDDPAEQAFGDPLRRFTRIFDREPRRSRMNLQARELPGPTSNLDASMQVAKPDKVDETVSEDITRKFDYSSAPIAEREAVLTGWEQEEEEAHLVKGIKLANVVLGNTTKNISGSVAGSSHLADSCTNVQKFPQSPHIQDTAVGDEDPSREEGGGAVLVIPSHKTQLLGIISSIDSIKGDERDSVHPLKQGLIRREWEADFDNPKVEDEPHPTKPEARRHEDQCILQSTCAPDAYENIEVPLSNIEAKEIHLKMSVSCNPENIEQTETEQPSNTSHFTNCTTSLALPEEVSKEMSSSTFTPNTEKFHPQLASFRDKMHAK